MAEIEYDGYTTVLTATANVAPCQTYHIRMVVADIGDGILDSGVFLKANSFGAGGQVNIFVNIPGISSNDIAYEGCSSGELIFERDPDSDLSLDFTVDFTISPSSTATEGVDYSSIPNPVIIPAGQSSIIIPFNIFDDGIIEGEETIGIELDNPCSCGGSSVRIRIDDLEPLAITLDNFIGCGTAETELIPVVVGGVPDFVYQWSNGSTEPTLTISTTTDATYTVTISDLCGMSMEATSIVEVVTASTAELWGEALVCDENTLVELEITFIGQGPWEIDYLQDGVPAGLISNITDNPYTLQVYGPGIYELFSLTDTSGLCEGDVGGIVFIEELIIELTSDVSNVSCFGLDDGAIFVIAGGGTPYYTYTWSNGGLGEYLGNLAPGNYTVTTTDLNGCTLQETFTINEASEITTAITPTGMIDCTTPQGGAADLNVNGGLPGYSFEWSNGMTTEDITNLPEGTYSVTIYDSNGCTAENSIDIVGNFELPVAVATVDGIIDCHGGTATISGSGSSGNVPNNYEWYLNGILVSTQETFTVTEAGSYDLVLTSDLNGCTAEASVSVQTNLEEPIPVAVALGFITCINESVILDGSGSTGNGILLLEWFDESGILVGTGDMLTVTIGGNYTLVVTDQTNGCSAETPVSIDTDINPPTPVILDPEMLDCVLISITLDGSSSTGDGSETLEWFDGSISLGTTPTIEVQTPGTYILLITNGVNGCTAEASVTVNQDITPPPANINPPTQLTCDEVSVILSTDVSGNVTLVWQDGSGTPIGTGNSVEVMTTGTYTLVITADGNGCTAETSIQVTENIAEPTAVTGNNGVLNCGASTASLSGSGSGIGPTITYEWYNESGVLVGTTLDINVSEVGTYTLVVTDTSNGCSSEATSVVTPDTDLPAIDVVPPTDITCLTNLATLIGSSSTIANLDYGWYQGSTLISNNTTADVTAPGIYTFVVTNTDNGCTSEATIEVIENMEEPISLPEVNGLITCVDELIFLIGDASEPIGSILYEWLDPSGTLISTDANVEVNVAGSYTLVVTNMENGCSSEMTTIVDEDMEAPTPAAIPNGIISCNENLVIIDGSGSIGMGTISYEWLSGSTMISTDSEIEVSAVGTYTLIITDGTNGCTAAIDAIVDENLEEPSPQIDPVGLLDCINETVTLNASGSSGNGNISLEWLDGSGIPIGTGNTLDVDQVGTYTVVVTNDENGCTAEMSITVNQNNELPQPAAVADGVLTCTNDMVSLSGAAGGIGTLIYEWEGPGGSLGTDNPISVATPGTYTLVVTNQDNGCFETTTVIVDENMDTPTANAGPDGNLTCDVVSVTLNGNGSSTGTNITYEWQNPGGVIVSTDLTADVTEVGTYTLIVTNQINGCTEIASVAVSPDVNLPIAEAGLPQMLDCNIDMVTLSGAGSSTGTNFEYEWLSATAVLLGTDLDLDVAAAGTYTLVVTNTDNGCTSTASVQVNLDLSTPPADAGTPQLLTCDVNMVTLNGAGSDGVAYEWIDPNGTVIGTETTVDVELPGTYQILVTGANGCTALAAVEVAVDADLPVADPGTAGILTCVQNMLTLGGPQTTTGPNISYEWLDENNQAVGTDLTLNVTTPGTYTLNVYNTQNDCDATGQVFVGLDQAYPEVDPGEAGTLTCDLTEILLGGAGTSTGADIEYSWLDAAGIEIGTDLEITVNQSGIYTLVVSNTSNDCVSSASIEIDDDLLPPLADAGLNQLLTCDIAAVSLDGSGSLPNSGFLDYEWTNAGGVVVGTTPVVSVDEAGTYQLLVTGDNGCTALANVDVNIDADVPVADAGLGGQLDCNVSMISIGGLSTSTGADIVYEWTNSANQVVGITSILDVTLPDIYTLTVYNQANDCEISSSVEVTQDIITPIADPGTGGILTCEVLEINVGGGNTTTDADIQYIWENELGIVVGNEIDLNVNTAGVYTLYVNNMNNGCSANQSVTITQNVTAPLANAGVPSILTCEVTSVVLDGSGSSVGANFSYEWYNSTGILVSTDLNPTVSEADDYLLIVTDNSNACTSTSNVSITPDANLPTALAATPNMLTCTIQEVTLNGAASSTVSGQIEYEWLNAASTVIADSSITFVTQPGIYTLIITDPNNGCTTSTSVEVPQNIDQPNALAGNTDTITCDVTQVTLTGNGTGNALSYEWFNESGISISTSTSVDVASIGVYTLMVTDGLNGCTAISNVEVVPDNNIPVAEAGEDGLLTCITDLLVLNGAGSSTGTDIVYEWLSPSGQSLGSELSITVTTPGMYTLIVYDATNDCSSQDQVFVEENVDLPSPDIIAIGATLITCLTSEVVLDGSSSGPFGDLSFLWSTANGNITTDPTLPQIEANQPGTYTLLVTNTINGCTEEMSFDVGIDMEDPVAVVVEPPILTCTLESFNLNGNASSSNGDFVYNWNSVPAGGIVSGGNTLTPR